MQPDNRATWLLRLGNGQNTCLVWKLDAKRAFVVLEVRGEAQASSHSIGVRVAIFREDRKRLEVHIGHALIGVVALGISSLEHFN